MNRLRMLYRRYKKAHDINSWHARWMRACANCWRILDGEATVEKYNRMERHHTKLMRLAGRKCSGLGVPVRGLKK